MDKETRAISPQRAAYKAITATRYTAAQREEAYQAWRSTGALDRAALACNLPHQTVEVWCAGERWLDRAEREDAAVEAAAIRRARRRAVGRVDRDMANIESIADGGEKETSRLAASKFLLGVAGINERAPAREGKAGHTPVGLLSTDETAAIEAIFREVKRGEPPADPA